MYVKGTRTNRLLFDNAPKSGHIDYLFGPDNIIDNPALNSHLEELGLLNISN
jgi:hypothetical protein